MEGGHKMPSDFDQHWVVLVADQNAPPFADPPDDRGPNQNGLEFGIAPEFMGGEADNAAVELAAVSVALDGEVNEADRILV